MLKISSFSKKEWEIGAKSDVSHQPFSNFSVASCSLLKVDGELVGGWSLASWDGFGNVRVACLLTAAPICLLEPLVLETKISRNSNDSSS
jgi:hypothetical protein